MAAAMLPRQQELNGVGAKVVLVAEVTPVMVVAGSIYIYIAAAVRIVTTAKRVNGDSTICRN